mgnify:CR=1 FL=1
MTDTHTKYAVLWQKEGYFSDFKKVAEVPYVDYTTDADELQLSNVFKRCNLEEGGKDTWTKNEGLIVYEDDLSHSASVGDIIVLDCGAVYAIAGVGFTKMN